MHMHISSMHIIPIIRKVPNRICAAPSFKDVVRIISPPFGTVNHKSSKTAFMTLYNKTAACYHMSAVYLSKRKDVLLLKKALILCLIAALLLSGCDGAKKTDVPTEKPAQEETLPEEPAQEETLPEEPAQEETLPEEPAQEETIPEEPAQEETLPEEPEQEETLPEEPIPEAPYSGFTFTTTDRDGNTWDESVFAGYALTMINFWEPWCGPCVREMPDLQKLQENYADRGLLILGVYSTDGMEADVDSVLKSSGVTYPILHYTEAFERFESGYVPTTIFVDREGNVLSGSEGELYIGSNSYEAWAEIVEGLL